MVREIPLSRGKVALVDDEDFEALSRHRWYAHRIPRKNGPPSFYAARSITRTINGKPKNKQVLMHRVLMPGVVQVDHRDGDGLNNVRSNLRPATNSQNAANRRRKLTTASSRFRGVSWDKKRNRWEAHIKVNQRKRHLGLFDREEDAARAYDAAASESFREFAVLNFETA